MVYLTTSDNPWSPFTNWDEWQHYDIVNGYYTCEKIARLANTSEAFPDELNYEILNEALDQLVNIGAINKHGNYVSYVKVFDNIRK